MFESRRLLHILHEGETTVIVPPECTEEQRSSLIPRLIKAPNEGWEYYPAADRSHVLVDDLSSPRHLLKGRRLATAATVRSSAQSAHRTLFDSELLHEDQTDNSVVSELTLAPIISAILEKPQVQSQIEKLGFSGIDYVPPLAAVIKPISNESQSDLPNKWVVYPFVPGVAGDDDNLSPDVRDSLHNLAISLRQVFKRHGITPHDLCGRQFIYDPDTKKVHLIDTERYQRR